MEQLDVVALGATQEIFDEVKENLPRINKEAKKLKYKKGNEVEILKAIEDVEIWNAKLAIIASMYENDNQSKLYKDAQDFQSKNAPMTSSLKKKMNDVLSKEEINKLAKENGLEYIPHIFANFRTKLAGYISTGKIIRMIPSAMKMNKIGQKADEIKNKYKSFIGKFIVDNKDKSNEEILKIILDDAKEKQEIYKKTENEELKLDDKAYKLMKKIFKIKGSPSIEYDMLNQFGLYETFKPVTSIFEKFEQFKIRNVELNKKLLVKTHGEDAEGLNLAIDMVKNQPTLSVDELRKTYIDALKEFDPEIAEFAKKYTTAKGRYDLEVRESKPTTMAFTIVSEDSKAFVSSHYDETLSWQNTVAHEWGHALQLERSKTNFNNMEWQPIIVEKPSILSEYIYLNHLLKITKGTKAKLTVVDQIINAGLSRFYEGALSLRAGQEIIANYKLKQTAEEKYNSQKEIFEKVGYKDFRLKSEIHQYLDDLRRWDTSSIMLYQYLPAQANAIVMYEQLKAGKIELKDVYDNRQEIIDLKKYYKGNGIDLDSEDGFDILFKHFEDLLTLKEKLIKKIK